MRVGDTVDCVWTVCKSCHFECDAGGHKIVGTRYRDRWERGGYDSSCSGPFIEKEFSLKYNSHYNILLSLVWFNKKLITVFPSLETLIFYFNRTLIPTTNTEHRHRRCHFLYLSAAFAIRPVTTNCECIASSSRNFTNCGHRKHLLHLSARSFPPCTQATEQNATIESFGMSLSMSELVKQCE